MNVFSVLEVSPNWTRLDTQLVFQSRLLNQKLIEKKNFRRNDPCYNEITTLISSLSQHYSEGGKEEGEGTGERPGAQKKDVCLAELGQQDRKR